MKLSLPLRIKFTLKVKYCSNKGHNMKDDNGKFSGKLAMINKAVVDQNPFICVSLLHLRYLW